MKQIIRHNATIDSATPQEIAEILASQKQETSVDTYSRIKGTIALNANGAGQSNNADLNVSSQYDWSMERITIGGAGAVNALVAVYENQAQPTDMLEVIQLGTAGLYSDSFSNNIYVPANTQVILTVTGGVASGQVTFNIQIRQIKHQKKNA
jgi:hypothetical protein